MRFIEEKYTFFSTFEERMFFKCYLNLAKSSLATKQFENFLKFTGTIIGPKRIETFIKREFPKLVVDKEDSYLSKDPVDILSGGYLLKLFNHQIIPFMSKRMNQLQRATLDITEKRLNIFRETFELTESETAIISFLMLRDISEPIKDLTSKKVTLEFSDYSVLSRFGHIPLGLTPKSFRANVSFEKLMKTEIIKGQFLSNIRDLELSKWCIAYLSGIGSDSLAETFATTENNETLLLEDFEIGRDNLLVLDNLLSSPHPNQLLLHGRPGTGKTSFARSLAKHYNLTLYSVKIPDTDLGTEERLGGIYVTNKVAPTEGSIILVDEADDILNTRSHYFQRKSSKSWINNFLDNARCKIIWITNNSADIEESTMRRFSFSIEFKPFTASSRLRILSRELERSNFADFFTYEEKEEICNRYPVNADGVVKILNLLPLNQHHDKQTILSLVTAILESHSRITNGTASNIVRTKADKFWLSDHNTSEDLRSVHSAVHKYITRINLHPWEVKHALPILLYGPPGTGKTAFANFLTDKLLTRRASDISSMYVGQTEKNIAEAFLEASRDRSILFFDEADSFLYPRNSARNSWEKTATNELLSQMESFRGVVIFATNDIDGIDHAALRRFRFKIEFRPLNPKGRISFYKRFLWALVPDRLTYELRKEVKLIEGLTPGDFKVVQDRFSLLPTENATHRTLIDALREEVSFKTPPPRRIGY